MTVIVLTAVPPGLRGHLTRWLLEISAGVYIGHVSARVRQRMWERVVEFLDTGRALMVYSARNEQRLSFEVHGHDWTPVDFDGVTLMRRREVADLITSGFGPESAKPPIAKQPAQSQSVQERRQARMKFARKKPKTSE